MVMAGIAALWLLKTTLRFQPKEAAEKPANAPTA
jgi:hypothetical protein